MNICVDCIPYDGGKSGISVYVRNIIHALAAQGHTLTLLVEPGDTACFPGYTCIEAPRWTKRAVCSMIWHLLILPFLLLRWRTRFDGFVITAANRRACLFYPIPTSGTVHDLAHLHIPGKYSPSRMLYLRYILPFFARRVTYPVAISQSTATDMVMHWGMPRAAIRVFYNGLEALPMPRGGWLERNGLSAQHYLLYVSRIEHPGKNHVRLIEAFAALHREDLTLVCAGSDWKAADHVKAVAAASGAKVLFTGYMDAEDLQEAYTNAALYVFPSLFEGFGLSLIEAMSLGVPCACSSNGSLGELAQDVAETFDPYTCKAITGALQTLLTEPAAVHEARIARGKAYAKQFSWETHARQLAALFPQVLEDTGKETVLFGMGLVRETEAQVLKTLVQWMGEPHTQPKLVVTVNVDFVTNAVRLRGFRWNEALWAVLRRAALATADGMPLVLLSKCLRRGLPGRVTGADLVPALAQAAAQNHQSIYIFGGDPVHTPAAATALQARFPGLCIAGVETPRVDLADTAALIADCARIEAAHPNILFVALGNPKQELWMAAAQAHLSVPVIIGVGGSFNFLIGAVARAPQWCQKIGCEWIYRIIQEPARLWKRYAVGLMKFAILTLRTLAVTPYLPQRPLRDFVVVVTTDSEVTLDCAAIPALTQAHLQRLVAFTRAGKRLQFQGANGRVRRALRHHGWL